MSITSSIDFTIADSVNATPTYIIDILHKQGWEFDLDSKKEYLPVGDNEEYDWQIEKLSNSALWKILKEKEYNCETIGIVMTWKSSEIGGSFHFWSQNSFSMIININKKITLEGETDVNWYINKIIPLLKRANLIIESFVFSEHI